jgi:hypothetical protein
MEAYLKGAKDFVFAGFLVSALIFSSRRPRDSRPATALTRHGMLLAGGAALSATWSLVRIGPLTALAGLRSFLFLAVALLGARIVASLVMVSVARWVIVLVWAQLALVLGEILY